MWQIFKDASLKEFHRVYAMLGVEFDSWKGEAYYEDKMGPLLAELEAFWGDQLQGFKSHAEAPARRKR